MKVLKCLTYNEVDLDLNEATYVVFDDGNDRTFQPFIWRSQVAASKTNTRNLSSVRSLTEFVIGSSVIAFYDPIDPGITSLRACSGCQALGANLKGISGLL